MEQQTPVKRGRRTKFSEELIKKLCVFLEGGVPIKVAVGAFGISERAFHRRCQRDASFKAATLRARFMGASRIIRDILTSDDPRVKLEYLARCWPEEFGRVEDRRLPQGVGVGPPSLNVIFKSDDGKERTYAELQEREWPGTANNRLAGLRPGFGLNPFDGTIAPTNHNGATTHHAEDELDAFE